jgi:hypothetical protein
MSVTLALYMSRIRDTAENVPLHRVLANWGEADRLSFLIANKTSSNDFIQRVPRLTVSFF